ARRRGYGRIEVEAGGRLLPRGYPAAMRPQTLDHVALWVADRDPIAEFVTDHVGMHVIERTDKFTLVGSDARRGKLTLFDAEGPRERGALKHVALRVSDLRAAIAELPENLALDQPREGEAYFDVGEGLRLGLVEARTDVDYDLDHAALFSADPTAPAWPVCARRLGRVSSASARRCSRRATGRAARCCSRAGSSGVIGRSRISGANARAAIRACSG